MNSIDSMKKYKNDFTIKFAQIMQENLTQWKNFQKEKRLSLISPTSLGVYFLIALFGFVPGKREYDYDLVFHCYFAIGLFIIAVITNIGITNKDYQYKIKKNLFPKLLKIFGNIYYGHNATAISDAMVARESITCHKISNSLLESSKFFDKPIQQRSDDDEIWGSYNDVGFQINETDFGYIANNKNRTYKEMFKGIAMHFQMHKKIKSRVLILSKMSFTKIPQNYERVVVEYEKFNKKYDVWVEKNSMGGSGQIEARYLLNTAFLDRFMQIQTSFRVRNMKCSILGDSMLILLSTKKDLFEMNHLLGKIDDVNQYKHLFNEFASVLSFMEVLNLSSKTGL